MSRKAQQYFDFTVDNGLVFCQNGDSTRNNSEKLYIHEAKKLGATAVFFRRFNKEGEHTPYYSEPAVCIFDVDDIFFNSAEHIALHAKLWSSGKNEIYVLHGTTRVDIINARKPAESDDDKELTLTNLVLESSKAVNIYNDKRFSAHLFESGTFWEQSDFSEKIDESSSPYLYLLNYLLEVRRTFQKSKQIKLLPSTVDKLLVVCILIKFLEEIKDDNGKHTLKDIYKQLKTQDLAEAVKTGKFISLLSSLTNEFNGKVFNKFSESELESIGQTDLGILAKFLYADVDLQTDLDIWLEYYNNERPHSGRYCFGKTPMQTFIDSIPLAKEKMIQQHFLPINPGA